MDNSVDSLVETPVPRRNKPPIPKKGVDRNSQKRKETNGRRMFQRNVKIAALHVAGMSFNKISKQIGLAPQHCKTALSRPEIRKIVDEMHSRMASEVPEVVENIIMAAKSFGECEDKDDKKIAWDANKVVAQAFGLLPAPGGIGQAIVHQTFINNQTNHIVSPVISSLMEKHFGGMLGPPPDSEGVTEAEYEEANEG